MELDRKAKGKMGEEMARHFLEKNGYEIIEENYRHERSEIDLIGLLDNRLLVFVEVKLRGNNKFGEPEEFVTAPQKEKIHQAAESYIYGINWSGDIRFDVIAIDESCKELRHFPDAFD